jgi:hypothetical protein
MPHDDAIIFPMTEHSSLAKHIERTRHHIEVTGLLIERQKRMVEIHRAEGRETKPAEDLLAEFERSQKVFERELARLELNGTVRTEEI